MPVVLYPFPDIAVHVMKPEFVRFLTAYRVRLGETFVVETHDCHGGQVIREGKGLDELDQSRCPNPATGPVWVEGLRPGETLAAHILDVTVGERGCVCAYPEYRFTEIRDGLEEGERVVVSLDRVEVKEGALAEASAETDR